MPQAVRRSARFLAVRSRVRAFAQDNPGAVTTWVGGTIALVAWGAACVMLMAMGS